MNFKFTKHKHSKLYIINELDGDDTEAQKEIIKNIPPDKISKNLTPEQQIAYLDETAKFSVG